MKIVAVFMLAGIGAVGPAWAELDESRPIVTVYLPNASYPGLNLHGAEGLASSMFAQAGVRIRWHAGQPKPDQERPPIVITFTFTTRSNLPTGVFAYALVFERVHIQIFFDRVFQYAHYSTLVTNPTLLTTFLLAHVMVHEITHMLEGVDSHSREGIMKASWTLAEIEGMVGKPLSFTPEDIQLIHVGLAERHLLSRDASH